ncbi:MAG: DNA polymerase III subunit beta [Candidatus Acidiferrales bacterium]
MYVPLVLAVVALRVSLGLKIERMRSMDFFAEKSDLINTLNFVRNAVEKRSTIPILSHFLLEAEGFELRLTATDLEVTARTTCQAKVRTKGAAVVPGLRFLEIVRSAESGEIRCRSLENHSVQITYGRSSFKIVGLAKSDYPKFPNVPEPTAKLNAGVLADCVTRTSFAVSEEESRYVLNGALLKLKPDGATMVATDGHRLALVERKMQIPDLKAEFSVLIPRKALMLLPRLVEDGEEDAVVEISKDESHLYFAFGPRVLASRLLTGQFPNYESVLPKENSKVVQLNSEELEDVVRRVSLLADDRLRGVRFALDKDRLEVSASSPEYGEAKETIEGQYEHEAVNIGFNAQYLLDFLRAATGATSLHMLVKDAESAAEFRPCGNDGEHDRYVLMPLRF